jgi:peptide/nickel transport system permease protein
MRKLLTKLGVRLAMLAAIALVGGFLAATLLRVAPGFGMDERELDPRLSETSRQALRNSHRLESGLFVYYGKYLGRAIHGDLGTSQWLDRPVASLLKERLPVTVRSVFAGMLFCWIAAFVLAMFGMFYRGLLVDLTGTIASGFLIALPTGVVAMIAVYLRAPVYVAIAAVIFPKVFRYTRNLLDDAYRRPYVTAARARGVGSASIVFRHVLPLVGAPILALAGVSLSMAFGAAIPIEALCDSPGVGQLAWQAAMNRDLPLIINLTLVLTLITVAFNSLTGTRAEAAQ